MTVIDACLYRPGRHMREIAIDERVDCPSDIAGAADLYDRLARLDELNLRGIALRIGSQISGLELLEVACRRISALIFELRASGHAITRVDP